MDNTIKAVDREINNLILGGAVATQNKVAQASPAKIPVSVQQYNTFTSRTLTPYEIQLQQKQLSKNLLKGVS